MIQSIAVGASIGLALLALSGLGTPGLEGSKHDFSHEAWAGEDLCSACHTPHRSEPPKSAPAWDQEADLSRTFGPSAEDRSLPGPGTSSCLRCHDGTIASEAVTGVGGGRFVHKQDPGLFRTGHGQTDHPVGVEYPRIDIGRKYHPLSSVVAKGTIPLPDGRVECISCHDPHNEAGVDAMLVMSNARSALCLTCHRK
jgi:predicted CXXCH cytochrome family protein